MVSENNELYIKFAENVVNGIPEKQSALAAGVDSDLIEEFIQSAKSHDDVLRIIAEDECTLPDFSDTAQLKQTILKSLWRESKYRGVGSQQAARINALKEIASLSGIEPAKKINLGVSDETGVLAIPVVSMETFAKSAEKMQEKLKETARE